AGGGREAPAAIAGLLHAIFYLSLNIERMIDAPAPGGPYIFRDEERHHQGLEHAPAPTGDDPCASVIVRALEDLDPVVFTGLAAGRLMLRPQVLGQGPVHSVVVLGGKLTAGDAQVAGDSGLGVDQPVAVPDGPRDRRPRRDRRRTENPSVRAVSRHGRATMAGRWRP